MNHPITKAILCMALMRATPILLAQSTRSMGQENPIYLADSPIASESIARLGELIEQDSLDEAARLVEQIILEQGDRLIIDVDASGSPSVDRVHIPVRRFMHRFVLDHPRLLDAYRRRQGQIAQVWLEDETQWPKAARLAWLTRPGMIASLRQAQGLIESARFYAGLKQLDELLDHPDAQEHAPQALGLCDLVDRYINDQQSRGLTSRWAALAGVEPVFPDPAEATHPVLEPIQSLVWDGQKSPTTSSTIADLDGIVPGTLSRAMLTPITQMELDQNATPGRLSGANWKPTPWVAPIMLGDHLLTNDGITISCFDRFTLRPSWRLSTVQDSSEPPITQDARMRLGRIIEDQTSISVDHAGSLYIAAGLPKSGVRQGDQRLLKLNPDNGTILWSLELSHLDDSLSDASIRGPVVVDQGTVLVVARTSNRRQRLVSFSLVGLDAATGRLRFLKPIASAGTLPFQQMGQLAHSPIVERGVAYYSDLIGLACAIQIGTGEVLWARPMPAPDLYARFTRPSFAGNAPVINSHGLFMLSSDGTRIFQIDPDNGRTLASRPADQIGESLYLLSIDDDRFVCVSSDRVSYYRADRFATSSSIRSPQLGAGEGISGRIIRNGRTLLAPISEGLAVLDPDHPASLSTIPLDHTGNILALDGQIIVIDQNEALNFLSWQTASRLLEERIKSDPGASITMAELAYRAGEREDILPAIDRAIVVLRALPIDQRQELESSLFTVILDMIEPALARGTTPGQEVALGDDQLASLLQDLGALARTHEQIVAQRLAMGAWLEQRNKMAQAIASYQSILDQPALSRAMWEGAEIAVRAGLESSRRIGAIIERVGFAPYREMDRMAIAERSFLDEDQTPSAPEDLARRYPWSTITPSLLAESSARYRDAGQVAASIAAAESGIDAAERLDQLGLKPEQDTIDTLGRLAISSMMRSNRSHEALKLADRLRSRFPDTTLYLDARAVSIEQLAAAAETSNLLSTLGDSFLHDSSPLLLTGTPIRPATRLDPGGVVLYAPQLGRIDYLRTGNQRFERFWTRPSPTNQPPMIPWQGQSRVLVFWPMGDAGDERGRIESIETSTGRVVWSISDLRGQLAEPSTRVPDDLARTDSTIMTPAGGTVPIQQLMVACDGQRVVVCDRIGRAMCLDLSSGERLWQQDLPLNRVHDLDLKSTTLALCGLMVSDQAEAQRNGTITPIVCSIDPRSGEIGHVIEGVGHQPRWVCVDRDARLFVGTSERITAFDTNKGIVDWVIHDADITETNAAWRSGDLLLVLDPGGGVWPLNPDDGSRPPRPMNTQTPIDSRGWMRIIHHLDRSTILASNGMSSFDQHGQLAARDPLLGEDSLVDAAWSQSHAVLLGSPSIRGDGLEHMLYLLDQRSGRLLDQTPIRVPASLGRTGETILAVNGGVLVGYGEVSVFVRTASTQ